MSRIKVSGWKPGLNTVKAIKAIRETARLSLDEASAIVNQVLRNEEATFDVSCLDDANELAQALARLGMSAHVSEIPSVMTEG